MSEPLLEVTDLHAGYGRAEVLHGLNLKAAKGSVVTVIGPNGAGKSTLLNALMGVLPSRGTIAYRGQPQVQRSLEERVMSGISLVPETRALFGTMPVEDNLRLGAYRQVRLGRKGGDALEKVYTLFPRLKERRTQLAGTLSGGERQMLAVSRALMAEPDLLMLDEPSLGLAPRMVDELLAIARRIADAGTTVLMVEQNVKKALAVADRGYVIERGALVASGPAKLLARSTVVREAYLGAQAADTTTAADAAIARRAVKGTATA